MKSSTQVKFNSKAIPILVVLLALQEFVKPYKGWLILLVGFGSAWLLAYLWAQSLSKGLTLTRKSDITWAQIGDRTNEYFVLNNKSWAPALWVTIEDQSNLPGYQANIGHSVERKTIKHWYNYSICTTRGLYQLGPTSLNTLDPFGIYKIEVINNDIQTMVVVPPIVPLPNIQVADGNRLVAGQTRTSTTERTVSAAAVRQYVSGDDTQSIHWPTSARKDQLHVRLYDNTPTSEWWIIIDLDEDLVVGPGQNNTLEHSIILAASLADRGLKSGYSVGLTAFGQEQTLLFPKPGNAQHWDIVRALAVAEPGRPKLDQVLSNPLHKINKNTSVIIITSSTDEAWLQSLLPMKHRDVSLTVLHLDPLSFSGVHDPNDILNQLDQQNILYHSITSDLIQIPVFDEIGFI